MKSVCRYTLRKQATRVKTDSKIKIRISFKILMYANIINMKDILELKTGQKSKTKAEFQGIVLSLP